ncbi:Cap-specific mRNA (nucleoside-2'-O-)-methyltransferase 2 [Pseudolycoriella hygida]|uniref:Cap-specific mRNA (nucleoside-2'-O-)-methyltransferase 2 n=1 Tax=Pseudolycoriella hygida TaxID=35572 RepID=A0A9Q0MMD2_9DIPT|nr:Cap-specific mRNA (nucleoside-2'-O-)-methyltransferase 2 [Pseudolycoriella hygida]KAJ6642710.1 Cap-specific mRNA (nucleoside-2'-O-)-methyltransferase 2 [Pseudolycoriella hygida]
MFMNSSSIGQFFEKKFRFCKQSQWQLPAIDNIFNQSNQTVPELFWIKSVLNHVKDQLIDYPLGQWKKFIAKSDLSSFITWYLRNEVNAEFVTREWCKLYECLSAYRIVTPQAEFNSVHLCEAPGAFVASLNHYVMLNYPKSLFNWCATTLNPYHEDNAFRSAVSDCRFIARTLGNWEFGDDLTGDITIKGNVDKLIERCRKMGKISLVTADGSVDCGDCPNDQENMVYSLHFAEVVAALQVLDNDGSFILKMFTFFELTTISLLYFLVNYFHTVDIFKPATSKQCNSEVYVICMGFHRTYETMSYVSEMASRMPHIKSPMFNLDTIPSDFIQQVHDCSKKFVTLQSEAILSNINNFERPICHQQQNDLQYEMWNEYDRRYRIKSIPDSLKLMHNKPFSDVSRVLEQVNIFVCD